jgi:hypothetical protein
MFPDVAIVRQFGCSLLGNESLLNNFDNLLLKFEKGRKAHPASYTVGTECFPGLKGTGRGVDYPPYLCPRLKEE